MRRGQVKRAIEKENQKARGAGRREFNDSVRRLAAWVKKRDPRLMQHQRDQVGPASSRKRRFTLPGMKSV